MSLEMECPRCWGRTKDCSKCHGTGRVPDRLLSPHFRLSELVETNTGKQKGIANDPTPEIEAALEALCVEVLEPIRALVGPLKVNSGYRSAAVNLAIGGSKTSAHCHGHAADIVSVKTSRKVLCDKVIAAGIKLDQIICEPTWVHVGHVYPVSKKQRGERLSMFRVGGSTKYEPYNSADPRIA